MSATTNFILDLDFAQEAADEACYKTVGQLASLHNLVWRAGKVEGPYLDQPVTNIDADWLEAMKEQLTEALGTIAELEAANDALKPLAA